VEDVVRALRHGEGAPADLMMETAGVIDVGGSKGIITDVTLKRLACTGLAAHVAKHLGVQPSQLVEAGPKELGEASATN